MISASANTVCRMPDSNQNILPLSALNTVIESKSQSGANRDGSLHTGIYGNGTEGHIYAGHGIQHVNRIRTVKQTVEYLLG